jgi:hypothetical protein
LEIFYLWHFPFSIHGKAFFFQKGRLCFYTTGESAKQPSGSFYDPPIGDFSGAVMGNRLKS